jgi:hypothetical protein
MTLRHIYPLTTTTLNSCIRKGPVGKYRSQSSGRGQLFITACWVPRCADTQYEHTGGELNRMQFPSSHDHSGPMTVERQAVGVGITYYLRSGERVTAIQYYKAEQEADCTYSNSNELKAVGRDGRLRRRSKIYIELQSLHASEIAVQAFSTVPAKGEDLHALKHEVLAEPYPGERPGSDSAIPSSIASSRSSTSSPLAAMSHMAEMTSVSVMPLSRHWRDTSLISETRNRQSNRMFVAS